MTTCEICGKSGNKSITHDTGCRLIKQAKKKNNNYFIAYNMEHKTFYLIVPFHEIENSNTPIYWEIEGVFYRTNNYQAISLLADSQFIQPPIARLINRFNIEEIHLANETINNNMSILS